MEELDEFLEILSDVLELLNKDIGSPKSPELPLLLEPLGELMEWSFNMQSQSKPWNFLPSLALNQ